MATFEKSGNPLDREFFICTSERENNIVGVFNEKNMPHQSMIVPESIANAIRECIDKEMYLCYQN